MADYYDAEVKQRILETISVGQLKDAVRFIASVNETSDLLDIIREYDSEYYEHLITIYGQEAPTVRGIPRRGA